MSYRRDRDSNPSSPVKDNLTRVVVNALGVSRVGAIISAAREYVPSLESMTGIGCELELTDH